MNKYLRQLFTAVVALFVILGLSSTIIMAVRANALNNDPRNARSLYHQLGAYRGAILASDGTVMAKSEPVNDAFKYLRTYSNGPLYAPVTGFFSINQTADRGLEASRSMLLNGEADSLIWQRAKAMLTGATNQGASIETSIDPKLQQVAYDQLGTRDGAAVAIEVSTGRILAMVSTPSYDPNKLATHDTKAASQAYSELSAGQNSPLNSPLINRATSQLYPPGSTFKTIVASAALETGEYQTDTKIPAGSRYTLPGTATQLPNDEAQADGINGQISLQEAVAWSSNTAFAQLGVKLGASKVSDMATKLGFGSTITIDGTESTGTPMTATASTFPSDPTDDKLALASIGQGDTTGLRRADGDGRAGNRQQWQTDAAHAGRSCARRRSHRTFADQTANHGQCVQQGFRRQAHHDDGKRGDRGQSAAGHRRHQGGGQNRYRTNRYRQLCHRRLGDRFRAGGRSADRRRGVGA